MAVRRKKLILVISRDVSLSDVRYRALVGAGFDVIAATDIRGVIAGLAANPDAAMIGYSVPAPEKHRVWIELERYRTPTLELHRGEPVLRKATHHKSNSPGDFLAALDALLSQRPTRKAARRASSSS